MLPLLPSAPAWLPALPGAEGRHGKLPTDSPSQPPRQSWSPQPLSCSPQPFPRALETPRPLRRRSQAPIEMIFYSFSPLGHSTEHTSPSPQQHTRLFKREHNSSVYFTTVRILPFLHTTGTSLFRVNTDGTLQTSRALRRGTRTQLTLRGWAARGLLCPRLWSSTEAGGEQSSLQRPQGREGTGYRRHGPSALHRWDRACFPAPPRDAKHTGTQPTLEAGPPWWGGHSRNPSQNHPGGQEPLLVRRALSDSTVTCFNAARGIPHCCPG